MARSTSIALIFLFAGTLLPACPQTVPDTDNIHGKARPIPDIEVEDSLNFDAGDKQDWKSVFPMDDGEAQISLIVGDPFKGKHGLTGEVTVFTETADPLARAPITPNQIEYALKWEAEADTKYLVRIFAKKGAAKYKIAFSLKAEPKDPCEKVECDDDERCVEGECIEIPPPTGCNPPCRDGYECKDNECVAEADCPGGCDRGYYCSSRYKKCIKDKCYGKKCGANQYCRGGRCYDRDKPDEKPKTCDPPCGAGSVCKGTKCEEVTKGPISATIITTVPQGGKTVLVLNRGKKHHVKVGDTGKIAGAGTFTITQVYDTRAKAIIAQPASAIGTQRATINRR